MDIDIVAAIGGADVAPLVAALGSDFYVDEEALRRAVRLRGIANTVHQGSQLKVDLHIAGGTPPSGSVEDAVEMPASHAPASGVATLTGLPPARESGSRPASG